MLPTTTEQSVWMLIAASFEFFNKLHVFFRLYPTGTERVNLRV